MIRSIIFQTIYFLFLLFISAGCKEEVLRVERPEKIVSIRTVSYSQETYAELADLWKKYNTQFPSEDAYANWMYAYRYSKKAGYDPLLKDGLKMYPGNPTLLYLTALLNHGNIENEENISLLEKAIELDPSYLDPWFALTTNYMENKDESKYKNALKNILAGAAIPDEIMDYNYNVLSLLEDNSILITNGDNDTFPAWILTQIIKYRPDVKIVNRSLLNTEWYPKIVMNDGVPNFISDEELKVLRENITEKIKTGKMEMPQFGFYCDTLIVQIIEKAKESMIPVYFAATLYSTPTIERYIEQGFELGLVTLITPSETNYSSQVTNVVNKWLTEFRTGSLKSWTLLYGEKSNAGKRLMLNYAAALDHMMDAIIKYAPNNRLELFKWYRDNLFELISSFDIDKFNKMWCRSKDIKSISDWCEKENILE